MSLSLHDVSLLTSLDDLSSLGEKKVVVTCLNAHSYNVAQHDEKYAEILKKSDALLPDGIAIVWGCKFLKAKSRPRKRIVGWDLFVYEMSRLNERGGRCMFLGSSEKTLALICKRAQTEYPNIEVLTYSPPYKAEFSDEESRAMVEAVNHANPDLLWIGMTAPKQEKWTYAHWDELKINCHVGCIGAVFDFFAGTVKRAPLWWQDHSLEWLYRLLTEPRRMWRRYILGNPLFIWNVMKEKMRPKAQ